MIDLVSFGLGFASASFWMAVIASAGWLYERRRLRVLEKTRAMGRFREAARYHGADLMDRRWRR